MNIENQIQICEILTALNGFIDPGSNFELSELEQIPVLLDMEIPCPEDLKLCELRSVGKVAGALLKAAVRCKEVLNYLSETSLIFRINDLLGDRLKTGDLSLIKDNIFWDIFIRIQDPSSTPVLLLSQSAEFFGRQIREKFRYYLQTHIDMLSSEVIYYSVMTGVLSPDLSIFKRINELSRVENNAIHFASRLHSYGMLKKDCLEMITENQIG